MAQVFIVNYNTLARIDKLFDSIDRDFQLCADLIKPNPESQLAALINGMKARVLGDLRDTINEMTHAKNNVASLDELRIQCAALESRANEFKDHANIRKILSKIQSEHAFLTSTSNQQISSNLPWLEMLLNCAIHMIPNGLTLSTRKVGQMVIDIICHGGRTWIKISAMSMKRLLLMQNDNNYFGERSVVDTAVLMVKHAALQPVHMRPSQLIYLFSQGIPDGLRERLTKIGVSVVTNLADIHEPLATPVADLKGYNLDITALLAMVSFTCHDATPDNTFTCDKITKQLQEELLNPVRVQLEQLFHKSVPLYASTMAIRMFESILKIRGGVREKARGVDILNSIIKLDDTIPPLISKVIRTRKITDIQLAIFGTGAAHNLRTITSNIGFVNKVREVGVVFDVAIIGARSLSESYVTLNVK
jgi:hypothetical protein